jgi:hypothetical protein
VMSGSPSRSSRLSKSQLQFTERSRRCVYTHKLGYGHSKRSEQDPGPSRPASTGDRGNGHHGQSNELATTV